MLVKAKVRTIGEDNIWEEEYSIPRDGESAEAVIARFNATLKPGERARELVSFEYITIDPRSDVELLLFGYNEVVTLPVERIEEFFKPSQAMLLFLKAAPVGSMYDIDVEANSHFSYGILIVAGQGKQFNIQASLPMTDPEDCDSCGEGASEMEWEGGGWTCPACGAVQ